MSLHDEILQQPATARRLLGLRGAAFDRVAEVLGRRRPTFVLIAARGSSDHAALYAQYLFAIRNALPVGLATPSAFTFYGARPRLAGSLVVGISQSGRSPDIVAVLDEAAAQGAMTLALTNDGSSPLARTAQQVVELHAGVEQATAATKTYTLELLAVALLSCALDAATTDEEQDLAAIPTWMEQALTVEAEAERVATAHADVTRCIVLGRGYEYATAREWALKLQELAQVLAVPYSAADFAHGPLALAEANLPVLAVAPAGPPLDAQIELLRSLRERHGSRLLVISDSPEALGLDEGLPLPAEVAGWLSPLVSVIPAQLYAYHLARAKGLDTERPRTITKVTKTR
jgi:glucosamine--fructose-6-phosphate aminotransferase (isomerizing)